MTSHIKTLLQPLLQSKEQPWKIKLLQKWPQIVGPLARKVVIEKIYQELIVLGVYDSCWMQELYLLSPTLLQVINQNLDQPRMKQVRFKLIGKTEHKKKKSIAKNHTNDVQPIKLTPTEQNALNSITDPHLRSALKAFLVRCYREKKI